MRIMVFGVALRERSTTTKLTNDPWYDTSGRESDLSIVYMPACGYSVLAEWNVVAAFELSENSWVEYTNTNTNTNNNVLYYNRSDALKDNDNECVEDMLFYP